MDQTEHEIPCSFKHENNITDREFILFHAGNCMEPYDIINLYIINTSKFKVVIVAIMVKKFLKLTNTKELGISRKFKIARSFFEAIIILGSQNFFHSDIYLNETTMNNSESRFLSIEKKRKSKL